MKFLSFFFLEALWYYIRSWCVVVSVADLAGEEKPINFSRVCICEVRLFHAFLALRLSGVGDVFVRILVENFFYLNFLFSCRLLIFFCLVCGGHFCPVKLTHFHTHRSNKSEEKRVLAMHEELLNFKFVDFIHQLRRSERDWLLTHLIFNSTLITVWRMQQNHISKERKRWTELSSNSDECVNCDLNINRQKISNEKC